MNRTRTSRMPSLAKLPRNSCGRTRTRSASTCAACRARRSKWWALSAKCAQPSSNAHFACRPGRASSARFAAVSVRFGFQGSAFAGLASIARASGARSTIAIEKPPSSLGVRGCRLCGNTFDRVARLRRKTRTANVSRDFIMAFIVTTISTEKVMNIISRIARHVGAALLFAATLHTPAQAAPAAYGAHTKAATGEGLTRAGERPRRNRQPVRDACARTNEVRPR